MNETTKNFLDAWQQVMCQPAPVLEYRLYYNSDGEPVDYTTEDRPGEYIVVDVETYSLRSHRVRVIDGQLIKLRDADRMLMRPDQQGQACHPKDVSITVSESETHTKWSYS